MTPKIDWLPSFAAENPYVRRAVAALDSGSAAIERGANFASTLAEMTSDAAKELRALPSQITGTSPASAPAGKTWSRDEVLQTLVTEAQRLAAQAHQAWHRHHDAAVAAAATPAPQPAPAEPPTTAPAATPSETTEPEPSPVATFARTAAPAEPEPEPVPSATPASSLSTPATTDASGLLMGINLSGGEFGSIGSAYGVGYTYPTRSEVDYYAKKGLDVIRLPFLWERVQKSQYAALDQTELSRIDEIVNYAASKGLKVVIDAHGYGKGFGSLIGSGSTSDGAFADFWGKMAGHYASNPNVVFGLMNEPNQQNATTWLKSANAAIGAIRQAGATNQVLVPGTYWDGAWTWTTSDNAAVIGTGIKDPANNFAFEVHQYLDQDGSGTNAAVVSDSVGAERLKAITQWAEATGNKLFLGEFGVASDSTSLTALDKMLAYMKQHESVWQGATYWAGGPWWGNYMYSAEPNGGTDKPQMSILQKYA